MEAIAPQLSYNTKKAFKSAKKMRKRVQTKKSEILTTPESLEKLQEETKARQAKKKKLSKECHKD